MTNNHDRRKLDDLHAKAEELAAHLFSRTLRAPLDSPDLPRLKRLAAKASDPAERRYQKSIKAWRSTLDRS